MEEEKKETKREKGTNFLVLLFFTIIVVIVISLILAKVFSKKYNGKISSPNDFENVEVRTVAEKQEKNNDDNITKTDKDLTEDISTDEEFIKKIIDNYDNKNECYFKRESKSPYHSEDTYVLFDFEKDEVPECIVLADDIFVYKKDNSNIKLIFGNNDSDYSYISEYTSGDAYFVKNNLTNEEELLIQVFGGEGYCYETKSLYSIVYKNDEIMIEEMFDYTCDSEEETRKREIIENNKNLSQKEKEDELIKAHTLKYLVKGKNVTEEKYEEYREELRSQYTLLDKTSDEDYLDLF